MDFKDLTPEQRERAAACESVDEILEFAKGEGIELTDEQLSQVSGGSWSDACYQPVRCPECGSEYTTQDAQGHYTCDDCGNKFG